MFVVGSCLHALDEEGHRQGEISCGGVGGGMFGLNLRVVVINSISICKQRSPGHSRKELCGPRIFSNVLNDLNPREAPWPQIRNAGLAGDRLCETLHARERAQLPGAAAACCPSPNLWESTKWGLPSPRRKANCLLGWQLSLWGGNSQPLGTSPKSSLFQALLSG